jgi:hypothetical protein
MRNGKNRRGDIARRSEQRNLYGEIPATSADVSIETAQPMPTATDSAPSSSPPNADGKPEVKSELTAADDAHQHCPGDQHEIPKPEESSSQANRALCWGKQGW